jgi:hypothetical protein
MGIPDGLLDGVGRCEDHGGHNFDFLLDVATPQLYRTNAFRVLGLSVAADGAEMSRKHKKLKMLERLGVAAASDSTSILPIDPPPDPETIRSAGQRLHNLQARLVDELFWFWPLNRNSLGGDMALSLLQKGDVAGAYHLWSTISSDHQDWPLANHNLAVLYHALALDLDMTTNGTRSASKKQTARLDQYWRRALKYWAITASNEATWTYLLSRAIDIDDPRLTSGFVRRLRRSLPAAILTISIGLAIRAAKRGDAEQAGQHLVYVRKSGFDLDLATKLLDQLQVRSG